MLLQNKNAVIYGAAGSIGSTVAKAFAREGATVFLCGRTASTLETLAKEIKTTGGLVETAVVDALDEASVDSYVDSLVKKTGHIDISFNLIPTDDVHGVPIVEMQLDDFTRPLGIAMKTQFLTSRAAARHMIKQGSGVILSLTATPAGRAYPMTGGFGPACCAIEGFSRNLASELGSKGVRVVGIRSAGSPDSAVFIQSMSGEGTLSKMILQQVIDDTMLKKLPLMAEIANIAVFLASDKSGAMTGTFVNATCGTTRD